MEPAEFDSKPEEAKMNPCPYCSTKCESKFHPGTCGNCGAALVVVKAQVQEWCSTYVDDDRSFLAGKPIEMNYTYEGIPVSAREARRIAPIRYEEMKEQAREMARADKRRASMFERMVSWRI